MDIGHAKPMRDPDSVEHAHPLHLSADEQRLIATAVETGARQYFEARRASVPHFVGEYFSVNLRRGALVFGSLTSSNVQNRPNPRTSPTLG